MVGRSLAKWLMAQCTLVGGLVGGNVSCMLVGDNMVGGTVVGGMVSGDVVGRVLGGNVVGVTMVGGLVGGGVASVGWW